MNVLLMRVDDCAAALDQLDRNSSNILDRLAIERGVRASAYVQRGHGAVETMPDDRATQFSRRRADRRALVLDLDFRPGTGIFTISRLTPIKRHAPLPSLAS
jgi:hypothetical protein